jgi:hypothetical protein
MNKASAIKPTSDNKTILKGKIEYKMSKKT